MMTGHVIKLLVGTEQLVLVMCKDRLVVLHNMHHMPFHLAMFVWHFLHQQQNPNRVVAASPHSGR